MWILSLLCALIGSAANLFFSLRYPSVGITPVIALVIVHPLGRAWDRLLKRPDDPVDIFDHGALRHRAAPRKGTPWRRKLRLWLAQGTWNEKEHCCVYISSNVSFGFAFATDVGIASSMSERNSNSHRLLSSKPSFTIKHLLFCTRYCLLCQLKFLDMLLLA